MTAIAPTPDTVVLWTSNPDHTVSIRTPSDGEQPPQVLFDQLTEALATGEPRIFRISGDSGQLRTIAMNQVVEVELTSQADLSRRGFVGVPSTDA